MNKYEKLYEKIVINGTYVGIRFDDLRYFLEQTGFAQRVKGDHFIFSKSGIREIINIQPDKRDSKMAKDCQVKQVSKYFRKYGLGGMSNDK